jgi:polyribonucleotide nucleotidyltransferase
MYMPVREHPEINFIGLLIGPRGMTQKQLQQSSGAKIILRGKGAHPEGSGAPSHPDDDDELHVSIEGSEEAVAKATQEIQHILFNPQEALKLKETQLQNLADINGQVSIYGGGGGSGDEYQIELRIPNNMVGLVIGKGGENIHKIQAQTGASMQIAKESEMKPG